MAKPSARSAVSSWCCADVLSCSAKRALRSTAASLKPSTRGTGTSLRLRCSGGWRRLTRALPATSRSWTALIAGVATDGLDGADPFRVYLRMTASRLLLGGDDRPPGALDDGHDLGPLGRGDGELVERLRHVVHERTPLARCDAQVPVRALHVLAGVFLRPSGSPPPLL